jgi:hypothetical protein
MMPLHSFWISSSKWKIDGNRRMASSFKVYGLLMEGAFAKGMTPFFAMILRFSRLLLGIPRLFSHFHTFNVSGSGRD